VAKEMKRLRLRGFFDTTWLEEWDFKVTTLQRDLGKVVQKIGEDSQRRKAHKLGLLYTIRTTTV
jgi:hypothetical protein